MAKLADEVLTVRVPPTLKRDLKRLQRRTRGLFQLRGSSTERSPPSTAIQGRKSSLIHNVSTASNPRKVLGLLISYTRVTRNCGNFRFTFPVTPLRPARIISIPAINGAESSCVR